MRYASQITILMIAKCQAGKPLLMHILFPAIILIASYGKTRNSQSKESRNQNPSYGSAHLGAL